MIPGTDIRLVVDCRHGDNSSVFHVDMLDNADEWRSKYPGKEWFFDTTENDIQAFSTEDEACKAQRDYRIAIGYDPITGL